MNTIDEIQVKTTQIDYPTFFRILCRYQFDIIQVVKLWKTYQTNERKFFSLVQFDIKEAILNEMEKY
jgi:hypothetical protein